MLKTKNCVLTLNQSHWKSLIQTSQAAYQQARLQTQVATAVETNAEGAQISWNDARDFKEIPTETTFRMLRHFLPGGKYFKTDPSELINKLRKDYGDVFLWPSLFGKKAMLFVNNPKDFELVLRNEGIWPNRPGSETIAYHREKHRADFYKGMEGLISSQGEAWGKFRSAVNPVLMQPKIVKLYIDKMSQVNMQLIERIKEMRDPETFEVPATFEEEINRWTLESVSIVALDKQLGLLKGNRDNQAATQLFALLTDLFTLSYQFEVRPSIWKYVKTPKFKRLMKVLDDIQDITLNYVHEALERLEKERESGVVRPEQEQSVLEKLSKIDKNIAIVMAMDMLMAGVDTTSSTFVGVMLSLAKYPEKQQKLREVIFRILPKKDSAFTENSLRNIPYLRACIKESLRMYPLTIANGRVPQKDVILSGFKVPKGTHVIMAHNSIIRDEKHFPRPNEFLPERWLRLNSKEALNTTEDPNALRASSPFANMPFGFGARSCIGKRIVEMELELGLARIIRNFNVEFNHSTENAFKSLLINIPNIPLKFKFTDVDQ